MSRLVLGVNCVREALRAHGSQVTEVLVERGSPTLDALARFAEARGVPVQWASRSTLDRLADGTRHQGAAARAPELAIASLDVVLEKPDVLVVALDEIQDPQNFGAIVRSAVAFGADAVMWGENASAPLTPSTFRASAGAIEHATLVRVRSLRGALEQCVSAACEVVALDGGASVTIDRAPLAGATVIVVGSEGKGLKKGVRAIATRVVSVPMSGRLDSLNASNAVAVALYECVRQRRVVSSK
ncbi:MAG: RNA methyltransferase [Polyangiaceae bacterium]|nr:RNA methyltransferase [Polyangiaceae bacterium]